MDWADYNTVSCRQTHTDTHLHTHSDRDGKIRQMDSQILHSCSCFSLVLNIHSSYLILNGNTIRFKEIQLAWDKLINVCKSGQIFSRAQHCHDLQPRKSHDDKLEILFVDLQEALWGFLPKRSLIKQYSQQFQTKQLPHFHSNGQYYILFASFWGYLH